MRGIKLAIFRNSEGRTASLDIGKMLKHTFTYPAKWYDPILRLLLHRTWRHWNVYCMTCGRRIWFWRIGCVKPRCVQSKLHTRRTLKGADWQFDDLLDFDGENSEYQIELPKEPQ